MLAAGQFVDKTPYTGISPRATGKKTLYQKSLSLSLETAYNTKINTLPKI